MKKHSLLCLLLAAVLLISGCGNQGSVIEVVADSTMSNTSTQVNSSDIFSDRDYEVGYDESESAIITLNGDSAECSSNAVQISGGTINVTASGDGIDANGTLTISGGFTTVCGPTMGDTATLDYDSSAIITGGTFIGTGASGMAQTFSDSEQGVIAVSVGNQSAGTEIMLTDSKGNIVISYAPDLSFGVVILSSPDVIKGETYTITVGSASGEFAAS